MEYHAENVANALEGAANETLRDAIWALGHVHEYIDKDDVEETLRQAWHKRSKEDSEFDEAFNRSWEKATKDKAPPPRWPEPVIVRNYGSAVPKLVKWLGRADCHRQIAPWSGDFDVGKTTTLIDYMARLTAARHR